MSIIGVGESSFNLDIEFERTSIRLLNLANHLGNIKFINSKIYEICNESDVSISTIALNKSKLYLKESGCEQKWFLLSSIISSEGQVDNTSFDYIILTPFAIKYLERQLRLDIDKNNLYRYGTLKNSNYISDTTQLFILFQNEISSDNVFNLELLRDVMQHSDSFIRESDITFTTNTLKKVLGDSLHKAFSYIIEPVNSEYLNLLWQTTGHDRFNFDLGRSYLNPYKNDYFDFYCETYKDEILNGIKYHIFNFDTTSKDVEKHAELVRGLLRQVQIEGCKKIEKEIRVSIDEYFSKIQNIQQIGDKKIAKLSKLYKM